MMGPVGAAPRPMSREEIKARIVQASKSPKLPAFDPRSMAACLVGEIETGQLSDSTRDVLIGISAVLLKLACDDETAGQATKELIDRAARRRRP